MKDQEPSIEIDPYADDGEPSEELESDRLKGLQAFWWIELACLAVGSIAALAFVSWIVWIKCHA